MSGRERPGGEGAEGRGRDGPEEAAEEGAGPAGEIPEEEEEEEEGRGEGGGEGSGTGPSGNMVRNSGKGMLTPAELDGTKGGV